MRTGVSSSEHSKSVGRIATCCRYRYLTVMSDRDALDQWFWSETFRHADDDLSAMPAQAASFVSEHVDLSIPPPNGPAYPARPNTRPQPQKLGFIPPREWDREKDYGDEDPPQHIAYRLGWKVKVNRHPRELTT